MDGFIIVGNHSAITYKEVFPLIKANKVRLGYNLVKTFDTNKGERKFGNISWYSTFPVDKKPLALTVSYTPEEYPTYDNYSAIDVGKVKDIPYDYYGTMGVPISFIGKYCPSQFELIGIDSTDFAEKIGIKPMGEEFIRRYRANGGTGHYTEGMRNLCYYENDGTPKKVYSRILIKKKVSE